MFDRSCLFRCIAGVAATLAVLFCAERAHTEEAALTRARVAELARIAPAARVARQEAAVSGAAVTAAGVLSLENPVLSGMGGIRINPDGQKYASATATLSWPIDLAGQRSARIDAARADQRAALVGVEDAQRRIVLAALLQHALVLRDERLLVLASSRKSLTQRLLAAAEKRRSAGTSPELDVTLTALQQSRDAAGEQAARGIRDADKVALLTLLGKTSEDPPVAGDLVPAGDVPTLEALLREVERRPDVRAAIASAEAAKARAGRERASRFPTINVLAQYERDERANVAMLGLAVPIPVLNANRMNVLVSAAEVDVANARAQAASVNAVGEVRQRWARFTATKKALDALAPTVVLVAQAVELSTKTYELGEGDLASAILVRREAVESQAALVEAELAHANAKIELLVGSGREPR